MNLYMIRHGQSLANSLHMHAGWSDSPLTECGEAEARSVRPLLENIKFSKIYVSDLVRASRTAELALGSRDFILTPSVREINMKKISGIPYAELEKMYGEKYLECRRRWDFSPFGCESVPEFEDRVNSFLDRIVEENYRDDTNICVVTHAGVIRIAAKRIVPIEISDRYSLSISNASVTVFGISEDKRWRIRHWNYTPEL